MAKADKVSPTVGNLNRAGRKKGVPNKLTRSAKEAFAVAFDGIGGAKRLQEWAEENTTEFFKLYARLIPTEVDGTLKGGLTIRVVKE